MNTCKSACNKIFRKADCTIDKEEILDFIKDRINIKFELLEHQAFVRKEEGVVTEWFCSQLNSLSTQTF